MKRLIPLLLLLCACAASPGNRYFESPAPTAIQTGGIRMIPIQTPKGTFHVWTKRVGNNPRVRVLLLHGEPGTTHEYYEVVDSFFPAAGIEYYFYDQLGSYYSEQPNDPDLWDLPRFVEEVEQVRQALGLNKDNFYLVGHSWGGLLALQHPDAGRRRTLRHDGPKAHGMDGVADAECALPLLPERQPHGAL